MNEFNNRIDAQRQILRVVNRRKWMTEALCGLSGKAIDRWIVRNAINPGDSLVELVRSVAAQLFFLANRSQEQVTDEYKMRSRRVGILIQEIEIQIRHHMERQRPPSAGDAD